MCRFYIIITILHCKTIAYSVMLIFNICMLAFGTVWRGPKNNWKPLARLACCYSLATRNKVNRRKPTHTLPFATSYISGDTYYNFLLHTGFLWIMVRMLAVLKFTNAGRTCANVRNIAHKSLKRLAPMHSNRGGLF